MVCLVFAEFVSEMADQQQFFLKWNDFQSNMVTSFRHLRDEKSFTDVTLACEGQTCKAHKMVLSACSPYFKSLLEVNRYIYFIRNVESFEKFKVAECNDDFGFFKVVLHVMY